MPPLPEDEALQLLRGRPNPFENLVRPQRPDDRFLDTHVAALLRAPRELVLKVIDSYRLDEYVSLVDLPDSRAVTVYGSRGAGKTHLLEAIAYRDDKLRQILVRPAYFEADVPFEKYLLQQLIDALLTEDPFYGDRPFDAMALALTRRLLKQTLADMRPVDRLFLADPSGWQWLQLHWRGGEKLAHAVDQMLRRLEEVRSAADFAAQTREFAPDMLVGLVKDHIWRCENGDDALPAIRRQLYHAFTRAALLQSRDALTQFLEEDFTPAGARPFHRTEMDRQLLNALVEACALVRLPVVFAFDNMEGLFAPQGRLDQGRVCAFFDKLAQAMDCTRGLLFLLFVEAELLRSIRSSVQTFALSRIDQGVLLIGCDPVVNIELRPPTPQELKQLIEARIRRMLWDFSRVKTLGSCFPFATPFLDDLAKREELALRNLLLRLRDEYSRIVYRREPPPIDCLPLPDTTTELAKDWSDQLTAAARRLQNRHLVSLYHDLHVGLRQLLEQARPIQLNGMSFLGVKPMNTNDGHGIYSEVSVAEWSGPSQNGERPRALRICLGWLLALRNGMWRDLQAKFAPLADTRDQPDAIVVFWHAAPEQLLPEKTASIWEKHAQQKRAQLQRVSDEEVCKLVALPEWVKVTRARTDPPIPDTSIRDFLREKCQSLLSMVEAVEKQGD